VAVSDLNHVVPNGITRHVALLTTLPDADGVGAVEVSGGGYARVAWSSWIDETIDAVLCRKNNGTIEFPVLTRNQNAVLGFGVYSASTGGVLLAWGSFVNNAGDDVYRNFFAGEMPRFIDQELKIAAVASATLTVSPVAITRAVYHMAWSPTLGLFAGIASSGNAIVTSPDGINWTDRGFHNGTANDIYWSEDEHLFVAVAYAGAANVRVIYSADGITWTYATAVNTNSWYSVTYASWLGLFVAVAANGTDRVMTSPDGINWTARTGDGGAWFRVIAIDALSLLVAVGSDGTVMTSANGTAWTLRTASIGGQNWRDLAWSPDLSLIVAVAVNSGYTMTSPDGINWTTHMLPVTTKLGTEVKWSVLLDAFVLLFSDDSRILLSANGTSWTEAVSGMSSATWIDLNTQHPDFLVLSDSASSSVVFVIPFEFSAGYAEIDVIDENSLTKMQSYLPPGRAWTRDSDATMTIFQRALAYTFARIARRALDLLEEIDPTTTYELLEDWERVYGLPDECYQPTTIATRRAALQTKMQGNDSPTKANLIALAATLGYTVAINEYKRADVFTCNSDCSDALVEDEWMFVWTLSYWPGSADARLLCTIENVTPQHTTLVDNPRRWQVMAAAQANTWSDLCVEPVSGLIVAISSDGTNRVMTSWDGGTTWTLQTAAAAQSWYAVCYGGGKFVAVSGNGTHRAMYSTDGITWTLGTANVSGTWNAIAYSASLGIFVAVGFSFTLNVMTSTDGITFTGAAHNLGVQWNGVVWSEELELFVAVGLAGTSRVMTSPDGLTWTLRSQPEANNWESVAWSPELGIFAAVSSSGTNRVMTSLDGITWTARAAAAANSWYDVQWVADMSAFVAVSTDGSSRSMFSLDGITWTLMSTVDSNQWQALAYSPVAKKLLALASTGTNRIAYINDRAPL